MMNLTKERAYEAYRTRDYSFAFLVCSPLLKQKLGAHSAAMPPSACGSKRKEIL